MLMHACMFVQLRDLNRSVARAKFSNITRTFKSLILYSRHQYTYSLDSSFSIVFSYMHVSL